jgi:hypothetical protein
VRSARLRTGAQREDRPAKKWQSENAGHAARQHIRIAAATIRVLLARDVDVTHVFGNELIVASQPQGSIDEDREYQFKKWRLLKA